MIIEYPEIKDGTPILGWVSLERQRVDLYPGKSIELDDKVAEEFMRTYSFLKKQGRPETKKEGIKVQKEEIPLTKRDLEQFSWKELKKLAEGKDFKTFGVKKDKLIEQLLEK